MFSLFKCNVLLFCPLWERWGVVAGVSGGKDQLLKETEHQALVCSAAASCLLEKLQGLCRDSSGLPRAAFAIFATLEISVCDKV